MATKRLAFENSKGVELSGRLELPINQNPRAYAIFAHCFTCNKNLTAVKNISRALTSHGFGVLRFDFTGLGQSGGDFAETSFSSNVQDLIDVSHYLEKEYEAPKLIIGHSLGGAAAIFASKKIRSILATATIGAPSSPVHVAHLFESSLEQIKNEGHALVNIGGRSFPITNEFLKDISEKNMKEVVGDLRKPLLILHSPQDRIVGINNAAEIYAAAKHPKSFISLDGADHLLSSAEDSKYTGNVIAEWASRYIKFEKDRSLETSKQVVTRIGKEKYTTDILASNHTLVADEPLSVGGKNFGPSPYDLLLSSLGACTAMTLRMYADRKKWALEEVVVHLNHRKESIENDEHKKMIVDYFDKEIEIIGNLDDAQRNRLMEIADRCPVHRTLHNKVIIESKMVN